MPATADEVVLAPRTLAAQHVQVGARVAWTGDKGTAGYTVTGSGLLPEGPRNGYAEGAWITPGGYDTIFASHKFHSPLLSLRPGAGVESTIAALARATEAAVPEAKGFAFRPPDPPVEVAEIRQVRVLPIVLGFFLALLPVGAVGHAVATTVRRRSHDVAVLRALGMTQWQCRWMVVTQASVLAVIGLLFGVPLGLAVGRTVWRAVADYTPLQYVPPLAVWAMLLVATHCQPARRLARSSRRAATHRAYSADGVTMPALAVTSIVFAVGWALSALVAIRTSGPRTLRPLAATCALLAAAHAAGAAWAPLAPLVVAAWSVYLLALPAGRLDSAPRRVLAAVSGAAVLGWVAVLAARDTVAATAPVVLVVLVVGAIGVVAAVLRYGTAKADERRSLQWLAAAAVLAAAFAVVCVALDLMTGDPQPLAAWLSAALVLIPLGQLCALRVPGTRPAAVALVESIAAAGVAVLVALVYLVIVVGINGAPRGHERSVLLASLAAAITAAMLAVPLRHRLIRSADALVAGRDPSPDEVVTTFGARMSRAVPMDELMLQLAESLRATMAGGGAEIWTGTDGILTRAVSVPARDPDRIQLAEHERVVIGRARIGGPGWSAVWLPNLFASAEAGGDHRVVPIAHLGTLLGLLADLRGDVQVTIGQLRELAHGIYPPLLRDRGLGEALRTAALRSVLPCTVDVELSGCTATRPACASSSATTAPGSIPAPRRSATVS